jgi:hypothetical protein
MINTKKAKERKFPFYLERSGKGKKKKTKEEEKAQSVSERERIYHAGNSSRDFQRFTISLQHMEIVEK